MCASVEVPLVHILCNTAVSATDLVISVTYITLPGFCYAFLQPGCHSFIASALTLEWEAATLDGSSTSALGIPVHPFLAGGSHHPSSFFLFETSGTLPYPIGFFFFLGWFLWCGLWSGAPVIYFVSDVWWGNSLAFSLTRGRLRCNAKGSFSPTLPLCCCDIVPPPEKSGTVLIFSLRQG